MKNLPYFNEGGTCKIAKNKLSFLGHLKALEFDTFEDFCTRAEEILYTYTKYQKEIDLIEYKKYIYSKQLHKSENINNAMKDKCFEWILSNEYQDTSINDLYSLLGLSKKGK